VAREDALCQGRVEGKEDGVVECLGVGNEDRDAVRVCVQGGRGEEVG
jgi:hypothetical protein